MRRLLKYMILVLGVIGFAAAANGAPFEPNIDRTGGDYTNVTLPPGADAHACQSLCDADGTCKAWTFVKAGVQAPNPRCWLKNTVPPPHTSNCCTSGVKPTPATIEHNIDRTGGDYTNVTLPPGSNAQACRSLCSADGACRAWTFVKAGVQAPNPRCWLKNTVPPPHHDTCCASGVK